MKLKLDDYFLGPISMLHDPIYFILLFFLIFFLKKIRVALKSRTLIWVPPLLTITVK